MPSKCKIEVIDGNNCEIINGYVESSGIYGKYNGEMYGWLFNENRETVNMKTKHFILFPFIMQIIFIPKYLVILNNPFVYSVNVKNFQKFKWLTEFIKHTDLTQIFRCGDMAFDNRMVYNVVSNKLSDRIIRPKINKAILMSAVLISVMYTLLFARPDIFQGFLGIIIMFVIFTVMIYAMMRIN